MKIERSKEGATIAIFFTSWEELRDAQEFLAEVQHGDILKYVGKSTNEKGLSFVRLSIGPHLEEKTEKVETTSEITPSNNPTAYLFTMTFCPYGNQAEDGIIPVVDLLGDNIEIEPHYVIYQDYRGGGPEYCLDDENQYCSMHGIQELNQDVRELCVYRDQKDKYWDFVDAINKACDYKNVDTCWEGVAATTGVNATQVKTCEQNDALELLATEVELNEKYNVKGSPALVINDSTYQGGRAPEDYKTAICSAFNNAPAECSTTLSDASGATGDASCE